jgi:16S rRNA (adenine1518-N6/adenine1519-N6)-dimethyltransferase
MSYSALPPLPVAALLRKYDLRPDKRLGQNFLVDDSALRRIVAAGAIEPGTRVLEIGPGLGSLTRYLAEIATLVVAVELDGRLMPVLREVLGGYQHVFVVEGDILKQNPVVLMGGQPYSVIANIPYYITSAVIRHLLAAALPPERLVLTIQREVAERICAPAGEMSLLALSVQVFGESRIVTHLPAGAFYPVPKVDSAVVRVDIAPSPKVPRAHLDIFFRLAKAGFSQKRKTLRNSLAGGMGWKPAQATALLVQAGINPTRRAETLDLNDWAKLAELLAAESAAQQHSPPNSQENPT